MSLAEDECKHGIWPATSCTLCMHKPALAERPLVVIVARWTAKYYSKCSACGESIEPGDEIAKTGDDEYLCGRCSRD